MRPASTYFDRYPGLKPFDKGQSTIFFGRDKEKKDLYDQICLDKMVVLFGKSGLGKSSLLTAGIMPMLEMSGYLPIRLRLNSDNEKYIAAPGTNQLLTEFIESFNGFDTSNERKIIDTGNERRRIWEYVKAANFHKMVTEKNYPLLYAYINKKRSAGDIRASFDSVPVTPVFICDQFEEFFHHPVHCQQEFLEQLAEVVHDEPPSRVLHWLTQKELDERTDEHLNWCQQPVIKIIFSLRSDRFANMQSLVPYISRVLRNRYELKALNEEQAGQAITGPAKKDDLGPEYVPAFTYEEEVLKDLKKRLSSETNEIESSQLQIVCNYIESKVKKAYEVKDDNTPVVVDKELLDLEKEFPEILSNFYEAQLGKIADAADRLKARLLIEDKMVLYGQREAVSKARLNKEYGFSDSLIEELLRTRLIREESTSKGLTYELSHDTLLKTVIASKAKRDEAEQLLRQEEERRRLAEEARKKDEELKEQYRRLAMEMQLREEAQAQKEEVERLSKRLKRNARLIFFLTTIVLLAGVAILALYAANAERRRRNKQAALESVSDSLFKMRKAVVASDSAVVKDKLQDVALVQGSKEVKDTIKAEILDEFARIDSITEITGNKDQMLFKTLDSLYAPEIKEIQQKNPGVLDNKTKLIKLREFYKKKGITSPEVIKLSSAEQRRLNLSTIQPAKD